MVTTLLFLLLLLSCDSKSNIQSHLSLKTIKSGRTASILCNLGSINITDTNNKWMLINARLLYKLQNITNELLITNIPLTENRYSIAIYHKCINFELIGLNDIDIIPYSINITQNNDIYYNFMSIDYNKPYDILLSPVLSTYYTTINYYSAMSMQNITYNMKELNMNYDTPTFESVIQSDDNISIYDLNEQWKWTLNTNNKSIKPVQQMTGYYMETPKEFGFYCLYKNPSNTNIVPDCPNITEIIKEHSKMLYSSGIDFILPDDTNLDGPPSNIQSYVLQIRPNELIFDIFNQLKNNGTNVPKLAIWNKGSGVQWQTNLEFYSNYSDLIYSAQSQNDKNNTIQKKVYFIVNNSVNMANQTIISEIEYDGGKNDIQILYMWAYEPVNLLNNGTWSWMEGCTINNYSKLTTSMENITQCNYKMTKNSNLGSQISATFVWNTNVGSLAFSSPNKLNGRSFQLIIKDCLILKPENVFYPSFNEHSCGPHTIPNNYGGSNAWSVGLYKDINRSIWFADTYGAEVNRAFEPTKESGDYYWLLFQSCSRILRMEYYFGNLLSNDTNNNICNVKGEICCNNLTKYNDIWSLKTKNNDSYLLSNAKNEVNNLILNLNYTEICAIPPSKSTMFCLNGGIVHSNEAHQGPFILYQDGINPIIGSLAVTNISRIPIYRCILKNGLHFIANNIDCNNIQNSQMEYLLGYAAKSPSTAMARRLMRCTNKNGIYYHTIGAECFDNNLDSALLGFAL